MRLKYCLRLFGFEMVILAFFFGVTVAEEEIPFTGEINAKEVNLRIDATIASQVISTLGKGERVEVVLESYDWYKIRLPKDVPVYVKKILTDCIKYPDTALTPAPAIEQCLSAKILKERVNIRAKPSEDAVIVGIADENEVVNVIAEAGSWYIIEPIQNSFGWVHKKFIDKLSVPLKPEQAPAPTVQVKTITPQEEGLLVFIGRVEPYGVVFFRPATHKLITQDNQVFLLKANRASLNALNHQKVKVSGKIISGLKSKYPVIDVKIIEVAS